MVAVTLRTRSTGDINKNIKEMNPHLEQRGLHLRIGERLTKDLCDERLRINKSRRLVLHGRVLGRGARGDRKLRCRVILILRDDAHNLWRCAIRYCYLREIVRDHTEQEKH